MSVRLEAGVRELLKKGAERVANKAVVIEKSNAPVSSGRLMASIHKIQMGEFSYVITTRAFGDNGFQYPARIEAGQGVTATNAKALHFVVNGTEIHTKSVRPSAKSGFANKTISNLHI